MNVYQAVYLATQRAKKKKKKNRLKQEPLRSRAFLPTQIMFFLVQHNGFIRLEKTVKSSEETRI